LIGQRIKQLRLARGLSLDALAAEMGGIVTKQALSKYEHGKTQPTAIVLNRLAVALGVKTAYLWREPSIQVRFIAYRKGSGLGKREQTKVENFVRQTLEDRVNLQEIIKQVNGSKLPIQAFPVKKIEDAEGAAGELRKQWNLGIDPIANVTSMLEDHFVHVIEIDASETFDGISAVAEDDEDKVIVAAVVTRRGTPGERQRLNLTHELGHLVLNISENVDEEKVAFRFGGALLIPAEMLLKEIGTKRTLIRPDELLLFKRRFGMSLQALLYRLHDLDVITDSYYKQWCMDINRLEWRKQEPGELPPEPPQWLRQNVLRAIAEGIVGKEEAERMLEETIEMEQPRSLIERRAFLKLPIEERRRIMAEQAEKAAQYYEQDTEWREFQGGDIVEY